MQAIAAPTQTPQSPNFLTQDNAPHPAHFFCGRKCRTKYTYNASGDLLLVTDSAGTETSYEYDSLHRLVQVTDDDGGISAETSYLYDAVGNVILIEDAEGRYTAHEYNIYGEVTTIVVDPVTWDDGSGPVTLNANGEALTYTYAYDAVGNLVSETDPATGTTTYQYDNLGRLLATILDDSTSTAYAYDDLGNLESITDAEGNTTRYGYNELGWLTSETIIVDSVAYTETYEYDAVGQLVQTTDREGRVILYDYDNLGRVYQERWEEDLGSGLENVDTITYEYDDLGNLVSASEVDGSSASVGADYDYTYDLLGRVTELVADLDGLTPDVAFDQTYDSLGNRTEVAVAVGSTLDYVNDATYDALSRLVELSQSSQSGGNSVAEKLVTFDYDDTGLFSQLARYADLAATELVALTDYTFDTAGQLTELSHNGGGLATDIDYTLTYADSLLAAVTLVDGTMDFSYDGVGQLTGVDYTGTGLPDDDAYTYDDTGNRTDSSFVTGDHNRLLSDGTYTYLYDANGNRTARFVDADSSGTLNTGDTSITEYTWDHRNRLTSVTDRDTYGGDAAPVVNYVYDMYNRLIHKELDGDGDGTGTAEDTFWIYDGNQAVLQFDGDTAADLSHRYLWGDAVDQLLADETVDDGGAEDVLWTLTDWQGTVRDLATYDTSTDTTTIANHKVYDAYGNVYDETDDTVDTLFGYTGRMWDDDIDLQWNLNRWYDPATSRWVSEDPIGFAAGDPNLYRYVGNSPAGAVDPSGLWDWKVGGLTPGQWAHAGGVLLYEWGANGYRAGEALVTLEAGRAMGERAVLLSQNESGNTFDGGADDWVRFSHNMLEEVTGANAIADGAVGIDSAYYFELDGWERATRVSGGTGAMAGTLSIGAGLAGRFGAPLVNEPIPYTPNLPKIPLPRFLTKERQWFWNSEKVTPTPCETAATPSETAPTTRATPKAPSECPPQTPGELPGSGSVDTGAYPEVPRTGILDTGAYPKVPGTGSIDAAANVWRMRPTVRGVLIESALAETEYADWFHVGAEDGGTFELVDFQKGQNLVSLKTVDTAGSSWLSRTRSHIDDLATRGANVNGQATTITLDLRVEPGGESAASQLIQYGKNRGVTVIIKEYP